MASIITAMFGTAGTASAAGGTAGTIPGTSGIAWGACSDPVLIQVDAQCGYVSVPLDYGDPNGQQIQIEVSRITHTSSNYQGVILVNPGGPGESGLDLNTFLVSALQGEGFGAAAADYDWIGFDPRGVGSSRPAISCNPGYFGPDRPDYIPRTPTLLNYWLTASQSYAQACANASPLQAALLHNMTTRDVAMDMDRIRQALGQDQITYYGFSYGTDIGQVYATLFPTHVRRLIMDSNVNPLRDGYQDFNLDQDGPFNRNEDIWFAWLAKYDSVYHLGASESGVRKLFYATEHQLATRPAGGQVGPDEWVDIFIGNAYTELAWPLLGKVFADWVHEHNAAAVDELISWYQAVDTPGNDNAFAVYLSVLCTDSHWPLYWSVWNRDVWAIYARAPYAAWYNAWYNAPCIFWPAPSSQPVQVNGSGIPSALLIDQTLDAATPFAGSLVVRSLFPHSVLVAEPGGTGHAESLSGDLCVDSTIATYLQTGVLPPRNHNAEWDKTCPPPPKPVPQPPGSATPGATTSTQLQGEALRLGLPAVELR